MNMHSWISDDSNNLLIYNTCGEVMPEFGTGFLEDGTHLNFNPQIRKSQRHFHELVISDCLSLPSTHTHSLLLPAARAEQFTQHLDEIRLVRHQEMIVAHLQPFLCASSYDKYPILSNSWTQASESSTRPRFMSLNIVPWAWRIQNRSALITLTGSRTLAAFLKLGL